MGKVFLTFNGTVATTDTAGSIVPLTPRVLAVVGLPFSGGNDLTVQVSKPVRGVRVLVELNLAAAERTAASLHACIAAMRDAVADLQVVLRRGAEVVAHFPVSAAADQLPRSVVGAGTVATVALDIFGDGGGLTLEPFNVNGGESLSCGVALISAVGIAVPIAVHVEFITA